MTHSSTQRMGTLFPGPQGMSLYTGIQRSEATNQEGMQQRLEPRPSDSGFRLPTVPTSPSALSVVLTGKVLPSVFYTIVGRVYRGIRSRMENWLWNWRQRKRQSSIPAPEITTSLANGQHRPDHKLPIIPVPLNPDSVSPSHLGKSTPRLPCLAGQGKALGDLEHKCLCRGQDQKYPAASAWATQSCVPGDLPLWLPTPDSDYATCPHPRKTLPMAHRHHAFGPSTHLFSCLKVPFPSSPAEELLFSLQSPGRKVPPLKGFLAPSPHTPMQTGS